MLTLALLACTPWIVTLDTKLEATYETALKRSDNFLSATLTGFTQRGRALVRRFEQDLPSVLELGATADDDHVYILTTAGLTVVKDDKAAAPVPLPDLSYMTRPSLIAKDGGALIFYRDKPLDLRFARFDAGKVSPTPPPGPKANPTAYASKIYPGYISWFERRDDKDPGRLIIARHAPPAAPEPLPELAPGQESPTLVDLFVESSSVLALWTAGKPAKLAASRWDGKAWQALGDLPSQDLYETMGGVPGVILAVGDEIYVAYVQSKPRAEARVDVLRRNAAGKWQQIVEGLSLPRAKSMLEPRLFQDEKDVILGWLGPTRAEGYNSDYIAYGIANEIPEKQLRQSKQPGTDIFLARWSGTAWQPAFGTDWLSGTGVTGRMAEVSAWVPTRCSDKR